ncbi:MAG: hypothetical protein ACRYFX_17180 [Janthinobacterium lividum]
MKLLVIIVLNTLLASGFGFWLRAECQRGSQAARWWLGVALAWRLVFTAVSGQFPSPDIVPQGSQAASPSPDAWGKLLSAYFLEHPAQIITLLQDSRFAMYGKAVALPSWSNTLVVYKVFALLDLASGGLLWLNGLYLSIGCFIASWLLVRTLVQTFSGVSLATAGIAFLLWPSVVWWTSGLTKETLVLGSGMALAALVLQAVYGSSANWGWRQAGWWLAVAGLAWLHVRLRYFFALPLLGCLLGLAAVVMAERRGWLRGGWGRPALVLLASGALLAAVAMAVGGELTSKDFIVVQLHANYVHGQLTSTGRPHLDYPGLQPTVNSMARYFPLAAAYTLSRPWLGESGQWRYLGAGLENLALLALLLVAGWRVARGQRGKLPPALVLALLLYCLLLAGLIGLSTPNLGTLYRYRVICLPWLVLVALDAARLGALPGLNFGALWKTRLLFSARKP